jgi:hypothetical protein
MIKMNLTTVDTKQMATLVVGELLQLDAIPAAQRDGVENMVKEMKAAMEAEAGKKEKKHASKR